MLKRVVYQITLTLTFLISPLAMVICHASSTENSANNSQVKVATSITNDNVVAPEFIAWRNFEHFVSELEQLMGTNPCEAFQHLSHFEAKIGSVSLRKQLIFYKIKSELYQQLGDYTASKTAAEQGLQRAKNITRPTQAIVGLLYARASALQNLGDFPAAFLEFTNALDLAKGINDQKYIAIGLINIGVVSYLTQKFDQALTVFNDAYLLIQEINDRELVGLINKELGTIYSLLGETEKSLRFYQTSYLAYQNLGKTYYAYISLLGVAVNHSVNQRYQQAIVLYQDIIINSEGIGDASFLAALYSAMTWAQLNKADKDEQAAYRYMLIAEQYAEKSQRYDALVTHRINHGYALLKLKRHEQALQIAEQAFIAMDSDSIATDNYPQAIAFINILLLKAEAYYSLGNFYQAYLLQSQLADFSALLRERIDREKIDDLRLRYESVQADLIQQRLEQQKSSQHLLLQDSASTLEHHQLWRIIFVIVTLLLVWFLVTTVRGEKQLFDKTMIDDVTGINNRRRIFALGAKYFNKIKNSDKAFAVLMIDIDNFRGIKQQYGQQLGNELLTKVAIVCNDIIRRNKRHDSSFLGSIGAGEFMLLLPEVSQQPATKIAEQIDHSIADFNWQFSHSGSHEQLEQLSNIEISIRISHYNSAIHKTFEQLIIRSNSQLYKQKKPVTKEAVR